MLVFDQLKKNDPQLRLVTVTVLAGLGILLAGLWWVQIVSAREYEANLETQSFRTVRMPAVRGKILDRNGMALAENRPTYNVCLYLEELRDLFDAAYSNDVVRAKVELKLQAAAEEKKLNRKLTKDEKKQFLLSTKARNLLRPQARYEVASNLIVQISSRLREPLPLDQILTNFERHYETRLALPFVVRTNLSFVEIAHLEEQSANLTGVDLEVQSTRYYPFETTAGHILGSLKRDDSSVEGEEAFFSFRLPDFRGIVGIEAGFDKQLRGSAGAKSVLVNNLGYKQLENIWNPPEPGQNVTLTLDLRIQQAAERALENHGPDTRGAIVVMDVHSGDILAMASSPTINPNYFVQGFPRGEWQRINDLRAEINRATFENYQPGSIFKLVVAMAALEAGLDPERTFRVEANPNKPGHSIIYVGREAFRDTVPPGEYNFRRALKLSSNSYFITNGIRTGIERIVKLGQRLHFGERVGLQTRQDAPGHFPSLEQVTHGWHDGDTANLCIGQGVVDVTPLQMAVMTAAVANGGKVLWPRLVSKIESQDPTSSEAPIVFESGRVRDELGVKPRTLEVLRDAMRADVEDFDGTGKQARVPGMSICGKTGTAQKMNVHGDLEEYWTWFASFEPLEAPKYAVLVMVEGGASGGSTCAPLAGKVYEAIQECERSGHGTNIVLAGTNP
jgi:penicillin-binding protein 2